MAVNGRVSPVPLRPCEGPLTEPAPAVQHLPGDGSSCPRAVIEPGTASDGIRGKLSFVYVTGHIIMADGGYRTV